MKPRLSDSESTSAWVIGGGLTLIILAFGLSSAGTGGANPLTVMLGVGILLFVGGMVVWLSVCRPWTSFDDWSKPLYTGHDDHAAPHAETHTEKPAESHSAPAVASTPTPAPIHQEPVSAAAPVAAAPVVTTPATPVASTTTAARTDDLRIIEGIGPKIEGALHSAGILTFADLAKQTPAALEKMIHDAGVRLIGKATSWPKQAEIAASGDLTALKAYQERLRTGHE